MESRPRLSIISLGNVSSLFVLHLLLSIEQHDESGEILLFGSGTIGTHFWTYSSMYRTDKSIPVEPLSVCLTGGAVTDVHR